MLRDRKFWIIFSAVVTGWGIGTILAYWIIQKKLGLEVVNEAERILDE